MSQALVVVTALIALGAPAGASAAGQPTGGPGSGGTSLRPTGSSGSTGPAHGSTGTSSGSSSGSSSTATSKPQTPPPPATTPPMGWDSWDAFGCSVDQSDIVQVANWLVATGLRNAGYRYVIVDDCWYAPTRSANGSLRPNTSKFPNGMRWLGWYLHTHGLLFGLYASAGPSTCAQLNGIYPGTTGSLGHEQQDADTFASWGVDYVKYDWCNPQGTISQQIAEFHTMLDAIHATHRPMVFSVNPNSFHTLTGPYANWSAVANLVRMSPDLAPVWDMGPLADWYSGVLNAILDDAALWPRGGSRHWNDPDALVVGLRASDYAIAVGSTSFAKLLQSPPAGVDVHLTYEDMRTNMAMWAMMAAPLIMGADVKYLGTAAQSILLNQSLIAIDQDPLGAQARPVRTDRTVWVKPLSGPTSAALPAGTAAVALLNPSNTETRIFTTTQELGRPAAPKYTVRDVWTGITRTTTSAIWALVPAHGVDVVVVTPVPKPVKHHGSKPASGH
jgi:alpha-galactosidase